MNKKKYKKYASAEGAAAVMDIHRVPKQYPSQDFIRKCPVHGNGYRTFCAPGHPLANIVGEVKLSRLIMSIKMGRWVKKTESVQFRDRNKLNLSPDNLILGTSRSPKNLGAQLSNRCVACGRQYRIQPRQQGKSLTCSNACKGRLLTSIYKPSKDELEALVKECLLVDIARMCNVSRNLISDWCRGYGIPTPGMGRRKRAHLRGDAAPKILLVR